MNKLLKKSVPLLAITGILLVFTQFKSVGYLLVFLLTPIFLIYALINLKSEINHFDTKLRNVLIPTVIFNTIFIILQFLFKIMHYPGASLFKLIGAFLSILSLIVGFIYFIKNRENRNTTFTYELILVLYPAFIFIWYLIPLNKSSQLNEEYVKMITTSIRQTEFTNSAIMDSNCTSTELEFIRDLKKRIMSNTGGLNEQGRLYGFKNKNAQLIIRGRETKIKNLTIDKELKKQLLNVRIVGDAVFIMTLIENNLIIKNCLQHSLKDHF